MASKTEIKTHLNRYAQVYSFSKGYKFGMGANSLMKEMISSSVEKIINPTNDYLGVNESSLIELAEKQIAIFIDHMIIAKIKDDHFPKESNIIGEETFAWAKRVLCPMFPFC